MKEPLKEKLKKLLLEDIEEGLGVAQFSLNFGFFWKNQEIEKAIDELILLSRQIFTKELSERTGGLSQKPIRKEK